MATAAMSVDEELAALDVERFQAEVDHGETQHAMKLKLIEAKKVYVKAKAARKSAQQSAQQSSTAPSFARTPAHDQALQSTFPDPSSQRPPKVEPYIKIERINPFSDDDEEPPLSISRRHRASDKNDGEALNSHVQIESVSQLSGDDEKALVSITRKHPRAPDKNDEEALQSFDSRKSRRASDAAPTETSRTRKAPLPRRARQHRGQFSG